MFNWLIKKQIKNIYRLLIFPIRKCYLLFTKKVFFEWKSYADHSTIFDGYNYMGENAFASQCEFGRGSYVADAARLYNVKIGKYCSIGPHVVIPAGNHPTKGFISTNPSTYSTNPINGLRLTSKTLFEDQTEITILGNDVWIGSGVTVLPGIRIGDGSIIGAGSVVTKSTEPFGVYVGNPAKLIYKRFKDAEIKEILKEPWWDKEKIHFDENNINSHY